ELAEGFVVEAIRQRALLFLPHAASFEELADESERPIPPGSAQTERSANLFRRYGRLSGNEGSEHQIEPIQLIGVIGNATCDAFKELLIFTFHRARQVRGLAFQISGARLLAD